jgi:hypothetical protein
MKKPENMKSTTKSFPKANQMDRGLGFDGLDNSEAKTHSTKWSGNQHGGAAEGNFGVGPRVGNKGSLNEGPKAPPASSVPDFKAAAKRAFDGKFNAGGQKREHDGTRSWAPSATENYKGNIMSINEGRGPTKGNKQ